MMKFSGIMMVSLLGGLIFAGSLGAGEARIVGWIEKVRIYPGNFLVHAKLDTGAEYSSLHAGNLAYFTRDGAPWVRFELSNRHGQKITLERPLLRQATIKRHFLKSQKRPVIRLGICLGNFYKETDVNLVDRTGFQYRMLIGRKFLEGAVVIDPAAKYTAEPNCAGQRTLE